ncbi:MAG: peptidoglycan DD-metalloendopeptidase family protein [Francisellaceae bacterium]
MMRQKGRAAAGLLMTPLMVMLSGCSMINHYLESWQSPAPVVSGNLQQDASAGVKSGQDYNQPARPVVNTEAAPVENSSSSISSYNTGGKDEIDTQFADQETSAVNIDVARRSWSAVDGIYTVKPGDSLLAIAEGFHVTLADLQKWNAISEPSLINIGQKIRVVVPDSGEQMPKISTKIASHKEPSVVAVKKAVPMTENRTPSKVTTGKAIKSEVVDVSTESTVDKQLLIPQGNNVNGIDWRWPLAIRGEFTAGSSSSPLNIAVAVNTAVYAAASGQVLYAGVGTGGYGKMVILSHDNGFLSAYGNLVSVDVKEGQTLKKGQLLGAVGKYNGVSALSFEIRQDGQLQNLNLFYRF